MADDAGAGTVVDPLTESEPVIFSTSDLIKAAVSTAALLGIAEAVLVLVARLAGRYTHVNPQNIWMTPLLYAVVAALLTGGLVAVWRNPTVARTRVALFLAAFVGSIGVLLLFTRLHQLAVLVLAAGIAVQFASFCTRRPRTALAVVRRTWWAPAVCIVAAFFILNGSRAVRERLADAGVTAAGQSNVLLIILDTVRAASLSLYGNPRNTSPNLVETARQAVVFRNAFSTAPWTLPSHASMFTGRRPDEFEADWRSPLGEEPITLAAVLREHGYRTGGFAANTFYASRESGLARGFVHYEAYPIWSSDHFLSASSIARVLLGRHDFRRFFGIDEEPGRRTAPTVIASFLEWQDRDHDQPFFGFINLFDAHAPYLPPAPYDTLFGPRLIGRDPSMREGRSFTTRELRAEIDAYEGAIAYLDHHIGMLMEELDARGVLENTLVVVTSDHGEEFGEHDVFTHGNSLYRHVLHVPLLMRFPDHVPQGRTVERWVSTRDLAATILDLVNVESPLPGRSLARFWSDSVGGDTLFAMVSHATGRPDAYPVSRGDMFSVMAEPYRYIRSGDGSEEMFDLGKDPFEQVNRIADRSAAGVGEALRAYLANQLQQSHRFAADETSLVTGSRE